jgi:hypothetical protein
MKTKTFQPARIGENFKYVIDSDGNRLPLDDPRVVHVWTINYYRHCSNLLKHLYKHRGLQLRIAPEPTNQLLRKSKQVCTGKECPALNPVMGAVLHDMENCRQPDEVTLYYGLDCIGPCPAGAWPLTCDAYVKKLQMRNVVFPGSPAVHNNYFGQGILYAWELFCGFGIADILAEAEISLRLTAADPDSALQTFDRACEQLCLRAEKGLMAFEGALGQWSRTMARIPLKKTVEDFPKVIMIGGGNGFFFHPLFMDYFVEEQVLVKLNPMTDFISHIDSDLPRLVAFEAGQRVTKQYSVGCHLLPALIPSEKSWEKRRALIHAVNALAGSISLGRYRKIARKSRLLFADHITYAELSIEGDKEFPDQLMMEATGNVGLLRLAIDSGRYDAGFHSNSFNCFHGIVGQALSRDLAIRKNFPFVALEFDEIGLTAQNRTLLETLCAKAKKSFNRRKRKDASPILAAGSP